MTNAHNEKRERTRGNARQLLCAGRNCGAVSPRARPAVEMLEDRMLLHGNPPPFDPFIFTPLPGGHNGLAVHTHARLRIVIDGQALVLPANIGIRPEGAMLPLHTHDQTGTIHIESPIPRDFRLGEFFAVWGQPFDSQHLLNRHVDSQHTLTMTVNNKASAAFDQLILRDSDEIEIRFDDLTSVNSAAARNYRFVSHVYQDVLGRDADAAGLAHYYTQLNHGLADRFQIAQTIQQSSEFRTRLIHQAYVTHLQRPADSSGLAHFTAFLSSGGTAEQLKTALIGSAEYYARRGVGTPSGFLQAAYQDVLRRDVDASGLTAFMQEMARGVSRELVATALFGSDESRTAQVDGHYRHLLGRPAEEGGLASRVAALRQGVTEYQLVAALIASEEYFLRQ